MMDRSVSVIVSLIACILQGGRAAAVRVGGCLSLSVEGALSLSATTASPPTHQGQRRRAILPTTSGDEQTAELTAHGERKPPPTAPACNKRPRAAFIRSTKTHRTAREGAPSALVHQGAADATANSVTTLTAAAATTAAASLPPHWETVMVRIGSVAGEGERTEGSLSQELEVRRLCSNSSRRRT